MKKKLILVGGGVLVLLVVLFILNATGLIQIGGGEEFVAVVNGEGVKRSFVEGGLEQARPSYEAQGVNFEDEAQVEQVKQELLNNIINETLLAQYGLSQGITVSEETIESEYQQIIAQFSSEQEFERQVGSRGFTLEDVRDSIRQQAIIQEVVNQQVAAGDVSVSEEEIQGAYDKTVESGAEVQPFEEAKVNIEAQVRQQKINDMMNALINQLRGEAVIEYLG